MPFPRNADEMRSQGYTFLNHGECDGCHEQIEWWRTPQKRQMPMNRMPELYTPAVPHWANCPEAGHFRKKAGNK